MPDATPRINEIGTQFLKLVPERICCDLIRIRLHEVTHELSLAGA